MTEKTDPLVPANGGNTQPSLGLHGIVATVSNASAVVIIAALLCWLLTVEVPRVHEQYASELKALAGSIDRNTRATYDLLAEIRLARQEPGIKQRNSNQGE